MLPGHHFTHLLRYSGIVHAFFMYRSDMLFKFFKVVLYRWNTFSYRLHTLIINYLH